eukprot:XP_019926188.1 PREDICTED: MAM domain-containing glycosylphosphatidylinositol anchor protein 1-like [Crassostrea gigas]
MNAAALSKRNEIMTLVSSKAFPARSYCLTFYYHMLGSNMGDLKIFTQNGTQSAEEKWSTSGDQGDVWIQVPGIDLKLDPQTKILITARRDNGDAGDIAVDLIELWPYPSAVGRYFDSISQKNHKESTGKLDKHKMKMLHYSRRKRKLQWRTSMISKKNWLG